MEKRRRCQTLLQCVDSRAKSCLLLENSDAVSNLDDVLALDGIDEIYIGLNDLHLSMKRNFMFELLADGTVDNIVKKYPPRAYRTDSAE